MSNLQRVSGYFRAIDENTSGGILCSEGIKRDGAEWLIDGISWYEELPVCVEHEPPPVGVWIKLGRATVNGSAAIAGVWQWGPDEVPRVAETKALVKAGIYTSLSSGLIPLESEYRSGVLTITQGDLIECSVVATPADPLAKITQRSLDRYEMGRIFRSLPSVPRHAVERVMELIRQPKNAQRHSVSRVAQTAGIPTRPHNPFLTPQQNREAERQRHHATMGTAYEEQRRRGQIERKENLKARFEALTATKQ